MARQHKKIVFTFNSPVILAFSAICVIVFLLDILTNKISTSLLFCVYRSSLLDPLTYLRFFTHVFGHSGWDHLIGNLMLILIVGPMLEEKYGSRNMIILIAVTAFVTGLAHFILFPGSALLGASGVAFALILLTPFTGSNAGEIPITFVIVAVLYIGQQVMQAVTVHDNISQLTHIIGGAIGSAAGFSVNRRSR